MISLSSLWFTLILFSAPLLFVYKTKYRSEIFLLINITLLILSVGTWQRALVTFLWILIPYYASKFTKIKGFLIGSLVVGFIYLNHYDWIIESLGLPYLLPFKILGLSYILFRQIDFILNRPSFSKTSISLVHYLNYLLSFYTFLAGPIMRYEHFVEDIQHPIDPKEIDVLKELHRVFNGYIKIFVLSAALSLWASAAYRSLTIQFDLAMFLWLCITNALFIYFNFSGYCDVMIGMGKCAGFNITENFNKPYLAQDLSDFWSRWHMTLTRWLTDYVFNPIVQTLARNERLSMNGIQIFAFMVTFMIAGLWHGTTLNFLIYGLLQGIGVTLSKLYQDHMIKKCGGRKQFRAYRQRPLIKFIEISVTLSYVVLSFVFFGFDILALLR